MLAIVHQNGGPRYYVIKNYVTAKGLLFELTQAQLSRR